MTLSQSLQESHLSAVQAVAVRAVTVAAITCFSLPAFANSPIVLPCPSSTEVTLEIPASQLAAIAVAHDVSIAALDDIASKTVEDAIAPSEFLSPRAEDAVRAVFDENTKSRRETRSLLIPIRKTDNATIIKSDTDAPIETQPTGDRLMHTRLPGVSDDELSRYKKQMFRRDI